MMEPLSSSTSVVLSIYRLKVVFCFLYNIYKSHCLPIDIVCTRNYFIIVLDNAGNALAIDATLSMENRCRNFHLSRAGAPRTRAKFSATFEARQQRRLTDKKNCAELR